MTDKSDWTGKVGKSWAHEWQRTDRSFGPLTSRLVEMARNDGFAQALDIGCGAGEVTLKLAEGAPSSRVTGADISENLVEVARQRCAHLDNARIELADAARWRAGEGEAPDLLVSRHGVMFFDNPTAAFSHLLGQASPGARLVFSCFREVSDNAWVKELTSVLPKSDGPQPDPDAPGPFAFGRSARVKGILEDAGWRDIAFEAVDYPMIGGEGDDAVADALSYFLHIGPAARAVAALEGGARDDAIVGLREVIERHHKGGVVALPSAAWIVTARKAG
ncbi:MAG: class I SAM-dependent methyltransferase [Erythrobacter sp.]